jgi:hypothetical protein
LQLLAKYISDECLKALQRSDQVLYLFILEEYAERLLRLSADLVAFVDERVKQELERVFSLCICRVVPLGFGFGMKQKLEGNYRILSNLGGVLE